MSKKSKSLLSSKLGAKADKAIRSHADDPIDLGAGSNLPEGIENGVAQLVDCKFDVYKKGKNAGEVFFFASGVVKSPAEHNGLRIAGLRTNITEPLCDTPGRSRESVDDHFKWVLNEIKKLGVNTKDFGTEETEAAVDALKEAQPYFQFRTWKGDPSKEYPNPRVQQTWMGKCSYTPVEGEDDDGVEDETEEAAAPVEGDSELMTKARAADAGDDDMAAELTELALNAGLSEDDINAVELWVDLVDQLEGDKQSLGEQADEGDEDAIDELTKRAEGCGLDPDDYPTWVELEEAIDGGP